MCCRVFVCMLSCTYVYAVVYMCVCCRVYVCMLPWTYVYAFPYMYVCCRVYVCIHVCCSVCVLSRIYVYAFQFMYVCCRVYVCVLSRCAVFMCACMYRDAKTIFYVYTSCTYIRRTYVHDFEIVQKIRRIYAKSAVYKHSIWSNLGTSHTYRTYVFND
jgi:hypothetical protein